MSVRIKGDEVMAIGDPHPDLVTRERECERGVERLREVKRLDNISVVKVETDYFGGAEDGVRFGMSALSQLAEYRGFTHWVILDDHVVRTGTAEAPGNDWELTVGLLHGEPTSSVSTMFPEYAEHDGGFRVWAVDGNNEVTLHDLMSTRLWRVFSSVHFRWKA